MFWENFMGFIVGGIIGGCVVAINVAAWMLNPSVGGFVSFVSIAAVCAYIQTY